MENSILKEKIIETLNKLFPNMEVDADVFEHVSLIDDLGIDSISFVKLVIALEMEFNFKFDDDKLLISEFPTVQSLFEYVDKKIRM